MSQRTTLRPDADNSRSQRSNRNDSGRSFLAGFLGCGGLLALAALIAGVIYTFYVIAPVEAQLPNNAVPIIVNLTQPFHTDNVSLSEYTAVRADAIGSSPVQIMQLWVNGEPVDAHAASLKGASYSTEFSWRPTGPGNHSLMVVAVDTTNQSAVSNLIQVKAFPPEPKLLEVPIVEGDTLQNIATTFDLTPEQVIALNPQITTAADQPLPAGTTLTVLPPSGAPAVTSPVPAIPPDTSLLPAAPPPPAGPVAAAPSLPTNNPIGTFTQLVVAPAASRPAAPLLTTDVNGCTVTLNFTDQAGDEVGFLVYRASPGSTTFVKIAALDANPKTGTILSFSEPGRYGRSMYYISAFNGAGESQSLPAQATLFSQTCVQPDQVGLAVQAPKISTTHPLDRAFCYASLDNGPWTRMPQGIETYVYPVNGVFDFSKDLNTLISPPPTVAVVLSMRCGGFAGDALIDLGTGQRTIQPDSNNQPFQLTGQGFTLTATLNFGQTQVPPPPVIPPPLTRPEKIIAPPYDAVIIPDPNTGELNVMWRWKPVTCPPDASGQPPADCQYITDITGFRVYSAADVVAKDGLPPTQKLVKLPPITDTTKPVVCFLIVAYKDAIESQVTNWGSLACTGTPNVPTKPLPSANISPPINLKITNSFEECDSHKGNRAVLWADQVCQRVAAGDFPVLVWDWSNRLCQPSGPGCQAIADIDGYKIYASYFGDEVLVETITSASEKLRPVPPPSGQPIYCFVVRAFKGDLESGSSSQACLSPTDLGITNLSLVPSAGYAYSSYYRVTDCGGSLASSQIDTPDTGSFFPGGGYGFNVGYIHTALSGGNGPCPQYDTITSFWREGMVSFDVSQLVGRTVQKATFEWQRGQASYLWGGDANLADGFLDMGLDTDNDCATGLMTDIGVYKGGTYADGTLVKQDVVGMYAGSVQVASAPLGTDPLDVTALVNRVLPSSSRAVSFIFTTDQSHPKETKSCFSNYNNFRLTIQLAP